MKKRKKVIAGIAAFTAIATGILPTTTADAATTIPSVTPFATSLNGPYGIDYQYGKVYVAESSTGNIWSVNPNTRAKVLQSSGYINPTDVARVGDKLAIVTSGAEEYDPQTTGDSTVYVTSPGGQPKVLADLEAYELATNPDGQQQFNESGVATDALSNPVAIIRDKRPGGYVLVADAGANDVLAINPQGKVTTFFVPPVINTGACEGAPNNDSHHIGCDPVPTDITYGSDGNLYVTALQSLVPGEGRVYVLDSYTGTIKKVISGLTAPTGIVTDKQGNVYTSEVTAGMPSEGPPPPGFDPSNVGRIVKTSPDGHRAYAAVTMPVGLAINTYDNTLYSTAWSLGSTFLGMPDVGKLVKVQQSAFTEQGQ